jgi:hypothetical protein
MDVDSNTVIVKKCTQKHTIQYVLDESREKKEVNGNTQEEEREQHVM